MAYVSASAYMLLTLLAKIIFTGIICALTSCENAHLRMRRLVHARNETLQLFKTLFVDHEPDLARC